MGSSKPFLSGVVEGFYGRPWNARQRHQLFGWMRQWGLNTYLYAPKDDLKHRILWRELYAEMELAELSALIRDCQRHGLQFIFAVSPGLDMRYTSAEDHQKVIAKLSQALDLGCSAIAVLCDDIPAAMDPEDATRFGSLAAAHCHLANDVARFLRTRTADGRVLFCPTPYCDAMAEKQPDYLPTLGQGLDPDIDVLWTGPKVVSPEIPVRSIRELQAVLKRRPVIWDNLHANDYDLARVFLGPYSGRELALRRETAGILTNPNCQFEANFVPIRTLALYLAAEESWCERDAYRLALREWLGQFETHDGPPVTTEDLELVGDSFYLPNALGDRAKQWLADADALLRGAPGDCGVALERVRAAAQAIGELIGKLGAMRNRELLFALYPFAWALRAEIDLLVAHIAWIREEPHRKEAFASAEQALGISREGFLDELRIRSGDRQNPSS